MHNVVPNEIRDCIEKHVGRLNASDWDEINAYFNASQRSIPLASPIFSDQPHLRNDGVVCTPSRGRSDPLRLHGDNFGKSLVIRAGWASHFGDLSIFDLTSGDPVSITYFYERQIQHQRSVVGRITAWITDMLPVLNIGSVANSNVQISLACRAVVAASLDALERALHNGSVVLKNELMLESGRPTLTTPHDKVLSQLTTMLDQSVTCLNDVLPIGLGTFPVLITEEHVRSATAAIVDLVAVDLEWVNARVNAHVSRCADLSEFSPDGEPEPITTFVNRMQSLRRDIEATADCERTDIFAIDLGGYKSAVAEAIGSRISSRIRSDLESLVESNLSLISQFKRLNELTDPRAIVGEVRVVAAQQGFVDFINRLPVLVSAAQSNQQQLEILLQLSGQTSSLVDESSQVIAEWISSVDDASASAARTITEGRQKVERKLFSDKDDCLDQIDALADQVGHVMGETPDSSSDHWHEIRDRLNELMERWGDLRRTADTVLARQEVFGWEDWGAFIPLAAIRTQLDSGIDFWSLMVDINSAHSDCMKRELAQVNAADVRVQIASLYSRLDSVASPGSLEPGRAMVDSMRDNLPLIVALTNTDLDEQDWSNLSAVCGIELDAQNAYSLDTLFEQGVTAVEADIIAVSHDATARLVHENST